MNAYLVPVPFSWKRVPWQPATIRFATTAPTNSTTGTKGVTTSREKKSVRSQQSTGSRVNKPRLITLPMKVEMRLNGYGYDEPPPNECTFSRDEMICEVTITKRTMLFLEVSKNQFLIQYIQTEL